MIKKIRNYFKDITGNVRVFGMGSFLNDASSEMIYPLLPIFLMTLGASVSFVGIVEGLAESTAAIGKLISGWYSDRIKARKGLAVSGYVLSGLTRPLIALAAAPWHVLAARFTDRIGKGVRTSPRDALIAASVDPKIKAKAFGFHRAMDHAGSILGSALAMLILYVSPENYRLVFGLAIIPSVLCVFVLWKWAKDIPPDPVEAAEGRPRLSWRSLDKRLRAFVIIMFIFTLGNSSDAFLLIRAKDLDVAVYHLPLIWIVLHLVKTITSIPGGDLADKYGRRKVIIAGWIVYALIYAGFAFAGVEWHAWALFGLYGVYFGLAEGAEKALVSDLTPSHLCGTAFGFFHLAVGFASLPASIMFGFIWDAVGVEAAFGVGAGLALVASIGLAFFVEPGTVDS